MIVQRDLWLRRITQTLASHQILLDPPNVLITLEQMLSSLESACGARLESGVAAGLLVHLLFSCISQQQRALRVKSEAREFLERQFPTELAFCARAINVANQQFVFPLPEDEAYNLLGILKQIDIFINIGERPLSLRHQRVSTRDS